MKSAPIRSRGISGCALVRGSNGAEALVGAALVTSAAIETGGAPGSGTGARPSCAISMTSCQSRAGRLPPITLFMDAAVVVADPHAGDELRRVADEPGVAEILRRAGLAGGRMARQSRALAGARHQRRR